ncbi:MAG: hypothetical protein ACYTF9_10145 [Planctomycetota bacterium]|jgi:nitrate reductase cytochrome c-type subunit
MQHAPGAANPRRARACAILAVGLATGLGGLAIGAGALADDTARPTASPEVRRELIEAIRAMPAVDRPTQQRIVGSPALSIESRPRWTRTVRNAEAARRESLRGRAELRAYSGAPPVMPHSRNYVKTKTCLDCHAEGIQLGPKYGPAVSHPHLENCQQCHVESRNLDLPESDMLSVNDFSGLRSPTGGQTASDIAPPVIPHGLSMRTDCTSCHGPQSYVGLRTTHPERLNCIQCHGVSAALDQTSPFFTGRATMAVLAEDAAGSEPAGRQ